jgi:ATP-dependent RNA helicase DHX37/DHR1
MREIHQMREQLTYLVNTVYPQQQPLSLDSNLHPPTPDQELLLRQVITAGLIDQVARLNTERSEMGYVNEGKADKHFQYLTVKTNETVYIHPSSFLFGQHEEYVAYSDLVLTKKMYMRGVTAIHPSWLCSLGTSLCSFSKPLEIPPPRYDPGLDSIRCFVSPTYGPNGWTLPVYEVDMEDGINRYKYFMRFLLEGNIIPSLKALREKLSGRPSMITTPSSTQHKTLAFLQTLARNKIYNKKTLLEKLKAQPKFLLPEMKLWVNLQNHQVLEETWQQVGQKPLP